VPVAIDDFNVVGAGMPILDHPAVRLLKIDAELTTHALEHGSRRRASWASCKPRRSWVTDRGQARDEAVDHSNWLTALGVDFVQSFEVSPPVALDTLLAPHRRARRVMGTFLRFLDKRGRT
jgi:EAL domain-containing protein (putative c-di-GMP-specific phosphodiesterase class I)